MIVGISIYPSLSCLRGDWKTTSKCSWMQIWSKTSLGFYNYFYSFIYSFISLLFFLIALFHDLMPVPSFPSLLQPTQIIFTILWSLSTPAGPPEHSARKASREPPSSKGETFSVADVPSHLPSPSSLPMPVAHAPRHQASSFPQRSSRDQTRLQLIIWATHLRYLVDHNDLHGITNWVEALPLKHDQTSLEPPSDLSVDENGRVVFVCRPEDTGERGLDSKTFPLVDSHACYSRAQQEWKRENEDDRNVNQWKLERLFWLGMSSSMCNFDYISVCVFVCVYM